jgi:hypothetical protein
MSMNLIHAIEINGTQGESKLYLYPIYYKNLYCISFTVSTWYDPDQVEGREQREERKKHV